MSLPPIVAKITADTKDFASGINDAEKRLSTFAKVGGAAVASVITGLVVLTKRSLENADALAKQARSLGLSVAAFQKMALVAEEAGVEAGKLTSMLGLMQRNIEGLMTGTAAQTDAFKKLGLSISDLQGLTPDEQFAKIAASLDAITDPASKTALAMDVFGRSGREAINMLTNYGAAVAEAAEFQRKFGITLTDTEANSIERANDAVGRISMVFEGLGNRLAVIVAPALEATANGFVALAGAIFGAEQSGIQFFNTMSNYKTIMSEFGSVDAAKALAGGILELQEILSNGGAQQALEDMAANYATLLDVSSRVTGEMARDLYELEGTYPILAQAIRQMAAEVERLGMELDAAVSDGNVEAANALKEELGQAVENLQKAITGADALSSMDLSGSVSWADTLAIAFGGVANAARDAAAAAASIPGSLQGATGTYTEGGMDAAARGALPGAGIKLEASGAGQAYKATGGGGGGGGGLENQLAERLETLQEGLATEAEVVAEWYAASQLTLEEALAAKMLTEAEYMEARERLEKEHQGRLSGIREMANQSNLQMVLGAGEEILSAIGSSNKKAMKVAKVFGAAQALISTYQGAAEALKLPFPKNLAAAAAVIAKGIGFVNAIKSVNESGGGGGGRGGGGGSSGAGAATTQQSVQTLNFTVQNDSFGIGQNLIRQIAAQLNEAQRNGSTLIRATVS